MKKDQILNKLKGSFVVSCQAEGDDPFNTPQYLSLFAQAAKMGGAKGIRSEGIDKIQGIMNSVDLPMIALLKSKFNDGSVCITGSYDAVDSLAVMSPSMIAIDGTFRERENCPGPDFIKRIKQKYPEQLILADISTYDEAIACQIAGADAISTTLSGYTPETKDKGEEPDFDLIEKLSKELKIPLFAEGRINTPEQASKAMSLGAWCVITGSAITRPRVVTSWFVNAIEHTRI